MSRMYSQDDIRWGNLTLFAAIAKAHGVPDPYAKAERVMETYAAKPANSRKRPGRHPRTDRGEAMSHIEVFQRTDGKYDWHLIGANNELICGSNQGYETVQGAERGLELSMRELGNPTIEIRTVP